MLPAAVMVLMSVWEQLLSPKRTACQAMLFILLACASGAAVCCWQGWVTNTLLLPFMALLHGGVLVGTLGALAVRHNRWSPRMLWARPGIREAA